MTSKQWQPRKLSWDMTFASGKSSHSDVGQYPLVGANGVIGTTDSPYTTNHDTVAIGRVGSAGAINYYRGSHGYSDNVIVAHNHFITCPRFDYYLLQSASLESLVNKNAQPLLTGSDIGELRITVPIDFSTRHRIAQYLDHKNTAFTSLINQSSCELESLHRYKRMLLSTILSHGLSEVAQQPNRHQSKWITGKLNKFGQFKNGSTFKKSLQGQKQGDIPFFKVGDTNNKGNDRFLSLADNYVLESDMPHISGTVFPKGTIVFPKTGAVLYLNKRRQLTAFSYIDNNLIGFEPYDTQHDFWYYFFLNLNTDALINPGPVPSLNQGQLEQTITCVPPEKERPIIARYLDVRLAEIDRAAGKINDMIKTLTQYQKEFTKQVISGQVSI